LPDAANAELAELILRFPLRLNSVLLAPPSCTSLLHLPPASLNVSLFLHALMGTCGQTGSDTLSAPGHHRALPSWLWLPAWSSTFLDDANLWSNHAIFMTLTGSSLHFLLHTSTRRVVCQMCDVRLCPIALSRLPQAGSWTAGLCFLECSPFFDLALSLQVAVRFVWVLDIRWVAVG
jgi:hypothetical protein